MSHNWFIGQTIVCIKSHSQELIKEGDVFTVKGLRKGCCNIQINIGIIGVYGQSQCCCGNIIEGFDDIYWFAEFRFSPLDTLTDISEIEEILSQPIENLFKLK